jgi:hypothetical protein
MPEPKQAKGYFLVQLEPQKDTNNPLLGRLLIQKQLHGQLEATSYGQMLSAGTSTQGSACYVAIEYITGSLDGKHGSFSLHHTGIINRGESQLSIGIVPDSGTEELIGIYGTMTLGQHEGQKTYLLEYGFA